MRANVYIKSYKTKKNEARYVLIVREKGQREYCIGLGPVSKKTAQLRRIQVLNELLTGQYKREPDTYLTFDQFVEKFFTDFANVMRSKRTQSQYRYIFTPLLARFKRYKLNQIQKHDIERYLSELKVSNTTKNIVLGGLKVLFSKAVEWNCLRSSPVAAIRNLPENRTGSRSLTPGELQSLWSSVTPWQKSIMTILLNSGMRPGELSNFKLKDIDWEANRIAIVTDKTRKTKSGKTRYIPMNSALRKELLFLRDRLPDRSGRNVAKVRQPHQMEYVLCHSDGNRVKCFKGAIGNAMRRAGIAGVSPHGFRKTFCSNLARAGVHPRVAQELMGHSTINLTMGIYTQIDDGQLRQAVEALPSHPEGGNPRLKLVAMR